MKWKVLESEALDSAGYDPSEEILEIEFTPGEIYRYFDVPSDVFENLFDSSSGESYFQREIRGSYQSQRVEMTGGRNGQKSEKSPV